MHGRPTTHSPDPTLPTNPNRWRILGVLMLALLVTSIDHTIVNVAMPRLVEDLGADAAQLQWVVASYTIVFAGLLLTFGSLGDRFGRRRSLLAGLVIFLAGSVIAASAGSTGVLIAGRCILGAGGALIMPATLSILVNVFGDARERAKAIAVWTAASAAGIALGPIVGGALLRSFSWSSVFWINLPLLVAAIVGTVHLVPESRDPHVTRLDPIGAALSIAAISTLVYAVVQAPERGWGSGPSLVNFAVGATLGLAFIGWELRRDDPMLDLTLFRNRGFSAGSITLTLLFFAMAGTVFLQAQYLQVVLGYTPLVAGFAILPAAAAMMLGTGAGARLADTHGARLAVTVGTVIGTVGIAVQAGFADGRGYLPTGLGLFLFGLGAGVAMPPATEVIMATLPPARAGVGSAVNDTVREFGSALGVAVIGSVAATSYASSMRDDMGRFPGLSAAERVAISDNVGAAVEISRRLGADGERLAAIAATRSSTRCTTRCGSPSDSPSALCSSPEPGFPARRRAPAISLRPPLRSRTRPPQRWSHSDGRAGRELSAADPCVDHAAADIGSARHSADSTSSSTLVALAWKSRISSVAPRSLVRSMSSITSAQLPLNAVRCRPPELRVDPRVGSHDQLKIIGVAAVPLGQLLGRDPVSLDLVERQTERQPSVGPASDAFESGVAVGAEQDRWPWALDRFGAHHARGDVFVAGGDVDRVVAPDGVEDVEDLLDALPSSRHRGADGLELVDRPAEAESDDESAGADLIDSGERSGEQHGRVPGRDEHVGADRDVFGDAWRRR